MHELAGDFLRDSAVQHVNLGLNYLPPMQSLTQDVSIYNKLKTFGVGISPALDGPLTGTEDVDYWIQNA